MGSKHVWRSVRSYLLKLLGWVNNFSPPSRVQTHAEESSNIRFLYFLLPIKYILHLLRLCYSIFIFPCMAALTFRGKKLTVFRDSLGSDVMLHPVRKKMSWAEGDVRFPTLFIEFTAPLFRHSAWWYSYYIHPRFSKVALPPLACWPSLEATGFNPSSL